MLLDAWCRRYPQSDVDYLVLDLIRGHGVEKNQDAARQFFGGPANRDDDSGVRLLFLKISLRQSFEVNPIVRQQGVPLTRRESQLVRIRRPFSTRCLGGRHSKAPGANQVRDQYVHVFVKV